MSANRQVPTVTVFLFFICNKKHQTVPAVSITSIDADLFHNTPLLKCAVAFRSPARSRVVRRGHRRLWHLRAQEKKKLTVALRRSHRPHAPPRRYPSSPQMLIQFQYRLFSLFHLPLTPHPWAEQLRAKHTHAQTDTTNNATQR